MKRMKESLRSKETKDFETKVYYELKILKIVISDKNFGWFYGAAFAGKSRTNNSLESSDNTIKQFFERNLNNLKDFLAKFNDFLRENSTLEKTSFPKKVEFKEPIVNKGRALPQNDLNFIKSTDCREFVHFLRMNRSPKNIS